MYNRVAGALVVLTCLGIPAAAQDAAVLERRLDAQAVEARRAQAHFEAYQDTARHLLRRLDTLRAGKVVVLTEQALKPFADSVVRTAVDSLQRVAGTALARIEDHVFVIRVHVWNPWERPEPGDTDMVITVMTTAGRTVREWRGKKSVAMQADGLVHHVLYVLYSDTDSYLGAWLGRNVVPDTVTRLQWMELRKAIVSAIPAVSRRCYDGDIRACAIALELTPGSDPIMAWHDPASRRRAVAVLKQRARRHDEAGAARCDAGSDTDCVTLLLRLMESTALPPLPTFGRTALAMVALKLGGEGALDRLLSPGTMEQRLATAARVPIDSVLRVWHNQVRTSSMPSRDLTGDIVAASLLWIFVLGFISTRSSRWR